MRATACSLLALFCWVLPGCGSADSVWVTVNLQKGGKPFLPPENQSVQMTFYGMERTHPVPGQAFKHEPFAARLKGEASYELPGPLGAGIPAGKYRISVIQKPKSGTLRAEAPKGKRIPKAPNRDEDFLHDRFGPDTSPIVRTVEKSCHLVIDLDRPTE
jgi:hypothetical protein